ncbi:MAG: hypothetical protein SVC26_07570 [Pseudomonadota bacterium]|nr:hypothetical protein [Pseudomonadota bacterium]
MMLIPVHAQLTPNEIIFKQNLEKFFKDFLLKPEGLILNQDAMPYAEKKHIQAIYKAFGLDEHTFIQPIVTPVSRLSEARDMPLSSLSLMAERAGRLIPIPFQFDEFDDQKFVYLPEVSEDLGRKPDGIPGKLDGSDELVFMFRDAGKPWTEEQISSMKVVQSIEVNMLGAEPRWVYLVKGQKKRSMADYINIDLDKGLVLSTVYKAKVDPDNFLDIQYVKPLAGPNYGKNAMKDFRIEVSAGVFSESLRVTLDNKSNIRAEPIAVKIGPIRDLVVVDMAIRNLGISLFKVPAQLVFYEQVIEPFLAVNFNSLGWADKLIFAVKRPEMSFAFDLQYVKGGTLSFPPIYRQQPAYFDGKLSQTERDIRNIRHPEHWVWIDGDALWQVFFALPIEYDGVVEQVLSDIDMAVLYDEQVIDERVTITAGAKFIGFPELLLNFLSVLGSLDLDDGDPLGKITWEIVENGNTEEMQALTAVIKRHLLALKEQGVFTTPQEMLEQVDSELGLIQFSGFDRELIYSAAKAGLVPLDSLENFDLYEAFKEARRYLESKGYDEYHFPFLGVSLTAFMPSGLPNNDPDAFYKNIRAPYKIRVN